MNIIQRNFFRLLRSGALNEFVSLEPMSHYKWQQLGIEYTLKDTPVPTKEQTEKAEAILIK